ncbi:MAG: Asp-tRNA(Asn)/Glu-tRNA(Gln) amidotransferase subunit GatA [Candidatus Sumerlaeia bacterium]|nr:Asp-tRNA(Asn)/Glu-tRNA(Gln) amidotransferase subunit GatA [Candidatus Sumerlaeia bacterium]
MHLNEQTITQLAPLLQARKLSSVELTRSVLERIRALEPRVRAYLSVMETQALHMAEEADRRFKRGENVTPLTGIPVALKDNLCTQGWPTTCASKILQNFVPPYDATVVARLKDAGAVFVGKTNLDEFAMGSSTENSAFQVTANPWDLERVPGGSSGGSAAAVAADECIAALGSDTGGSIRQPAGFCGVVGLKPTYGRVSRYGLVAFASSLDQIGPFGKTVADCALVMNCIAGRDPADSTSASVAVPDYASALRADVKGLRIGVPKEYFVEGLSREVETAVRGAVARLAELGAEAVEISLPHTPYAVATYYLCAPAEASSNLARYDGVHYGYRAADQDNIIDMYTRTRHDGFGTEVKRRIMLGTYALSAGYYDAYYLKALKVRTLIKRDFEQAFELCDVIATPTSPTPAFRAGEKTGDPIQMYLSDIFTISANLAGIPAISLPCGFAQNGGHPLPIGLQLIAPVFREDTLFRVAHTYEQATDFHKKKPTL